MRIAVIADIHGNIYALQETIRDIEKRNVDVTICAGDLVGYCPFPNEVIELVRKCNIMTIMGNYDDAVGNELLVCGCDYPDPKDAENAGISLNWTIDATTVKNKEFLGSLPKEMKLVFGDIKMLFVHGSPRQLNEYLKENSKEASEVMDAFKYDVLVCGHTHKPYYKAYGDKMLINAGSVGKPKTGRPKANYVIVDVLDNEVKVHIIEVEYEFEKAAKAIEAAGLPSEFAEIIRTGKA
ncbi:MAG: metallophosphoesterase family protein [Caulobacteraceae bacterium]